MNATQSRMGRQRQGEGAPECSTDVHASMNVRRSLQHHNFGALNLYAPGMQHRFHLVSTRFPPNVHFTQQSSKSMRAAERALAALLALAWASSIHGTTVLSFTAPVRPKQPNTFIINWGEP